MPLKQDGKFFRLSESSAEDSGQGGGTDGDIQPESPVMTCLCEELSGILIAELEANDDLPKRIKEPALASIASLPACPDGSWAKSEYRKPDKPKQKKPPSEYNQFISSCMKKQGVKSFAEAPEAMRKCSMEWKEKKKNG